MKVNEIGMSGSGLQMHRDVNRSDKASLVS